MERLLEPGVPCPGEMLFGVLGSGLRFVVGSPGFRVYVRRCREETESRYRFRVYGLGFRGALFVILVFGFH